MYTGFSAYCSQYWPEKPVCDPEFLNWVRMNNVSEDETDIPPMLHCDVYQRGSQSKYLYLAIKTSH
jgi:hypothetical protein